MSTMAAEPPSGQRGEIRADNGSEAGASSSTAACVGDLPRFQCLCLSVTSAHEKLCLNQEFFFFSTEEGYKTIFFSRILFCCKDIPHINRILF